MIETEPPALHMDDRSPYEVAMAIAHTIVTCADDIDCEQSVLDQVLAAKGGVSAKYHASIARAQHSIFWYQL